MEQVGTPTSAVVTNDPGSGDPLQWLSTILWPDRRARLLVDRRRNRAGVDNAHVVAAGDGGPHVGFRWWATPSAGDAELLIPATSIEAARTAVRRYHDGFTLDKRVRSWSAELLTRSPRLAAKALDGRLVAATGPVDGGLLTDLAAALAGRGPVDELHMAITLARPKSNRKPVVQIIDQNGRCLGWAKIGWNPWTRNLVANEADWLDRRPRRPVITPHVLDRLDVRGQVVVVTTGLVGSRRPRRTSDRPPSPDVLLAIADLGIRTRTSLVDTPWWQSVREVLGHATERETRAIDRVVDAVGPATVEIGAWHGDLAPWNLMSAPASGWPVPRRCNATGGTADVQVIDWEFATDGVPLGFDLCHFHTQVGVEMKDLSTPAALDRSARLSPQGLARLGVDPHNQINVYRLYLVELIRRTIALRAAGVSVHDVEQGEAATDRILAGSAPLPVTTSTSRRPRLLRR